VPVYGLSPVALNPIRERCHSTIHDTSSAAPQRASGDGSGTLTNTSQPPGGPEALRDTGELGSCSSESYKMLVPVEVRSSDSTSKPPSRLRDSCTSRPPGTLVMQPAGEHHFSGWFATGSRPPIPSTYSPSAFRRPSMEKSIECVTPSVNVTSAVSGP